jgi:hypothetical protein
MRGIVRRALVTISAVAVLVFAAAGVASASGTVVLTWSPATSAGTYAYPTINAGQKVSQAFTLTNSGTVATSALKIALANVSGTAFTKTADSCTGTSLGPKKKCTVTVRYAPTTPGESDKATLTATSANPKAAATVTLLGAAAKASPAITTSPAAAGDGSAGSTTMTDTATVTGGHNPTGTVTFSLYGPGDSTCSAAPVFTDTQNLAGGAVTSASFAPAQAGTYQWTATYNGDSNNNTAASGCGAESVVISKGSPAIATAPTAGGTVGTAVADTATVTGGANPTGTVTFSLYGPSAAADCSAAPVFTDTENLSGGGATSASFTPAQASSYWWTATYNGDANNNTAASGCNQEKVTLNQATPVIATSPAAAGDGTVGSTTVTDTATVTGGDNPTGTITFNLYGPGDTTCSAAPVFTDTENLSGGGATSASFTPTQAGTYQWTASYDGDTNNNQAASGCGAESVVISKGSPSITTTPSPGGGVSITPVTDTTTVTGGDNPTGTITFNLYGPGDTTCSAAPVFTDTENLSSGGATSASFTPTQAGTYQWTATYNGDTNNNQAASGCGDEQVTIRGLYWANQQAGTITEANLDGTGQQVIASGQLRSKTGGLVGVAVDASHLYWADDVSATITEANLDGTGQQVIASGQDGLGGVAVDASHLYWSVDGTIVEANLDGTGQQVIASGQNTPTGVAVDASHLYWANFGAGTIMEASLNGTGQQVIASGQNQPTGVAVDASHLYWANRGAGTIVEAGLDGTGAQVIASGQSGPWGVAVDASHLYWSNANFTGGDTIVEAALGGTGQQVIASGQDTPTGVAVGPQ